ncbi:MAG: LLM class flavin-dependent oxidoreductase [Candidatus Bathyarchaeota archaeon]|nr:LLM class flavin-dependent oxidoreductase [Candidatus Bathyarchaeota archaeon]
METSEIKFGYNILSLSALDSVRAGVMAEKHGFDSVWVPDHLIEDGALVDPWSVMAVIGTQTKHVFLCTGVTDTQRCHPAKTAQSVATVDELSHGRAGLGIGAGEVMNIVPFGIPWDDDPRDRAQRLREAIEVIKLLWGSSKEKMVSYEGKFFWLKNAWLDQHSTQKPHPPVYVGALSSTRLLELTGEIGDGWYSWLVTPETYTKRREKIKRAAERTGRKLEDIDTVATIYTAFADDPRTQRKLTELTRIEILMSDYTGLKSFGVKLPLPERYTYQYVSVTERYSPVLVEMARQIPEEIFKKYAAIGSVDDCIDFIESFVKVGAKHISVCDLMIDVKGLAGVEETLKTYGSKIIPYFKEQTRK